MEKIIHFFFRGRVGLTAILNALGVQDGDEIITQAFTCVAVPEGILAAGGKPVFADLRPGSVNLDPSDVAKKITPQTKAIIVQHTFGYAGPMHKISEIIDGRDIRIIEDCCHTFSTTIDNRNVGSIGDASFYSFEWGKPLPCGVGGAAFSADSAINESLSALQSILKQPNILRRMRLEMQYYAFAVLYRPKTYWMLKSIFKTASRAGAAEGNFSDLNIADASSDFGLQISPDVARRIKKRMRDIPAISEHSSKVVAAYRSIQLSDGLVRVVDENLEGSVLVRYPLWAENKDQLLNEAKRRRIELADWYKTPIHPLSANEQAVVNYMPGSCPVAEAACQKIVSFPTNRHVGVREMDRIRVLLSN